MYSVPVSTRRFPSNLNHLLVLRSCMREYKKAGGRITTSDESPESDADKLPNGNMYTASVCPSIIGHAVIVDEVLSVCETVYEDADQRDIAALVRSVPWTTFK